MTDIKWSKLLNTAPNKLKKVDSPFTVTSEAVRKLLEGKKG